MAAYVIPNGHVGAYEKTLVAATVDTVTFDHDEPAGAGWARRPKEVEVVTDGAASIFFTLDGSTPTVGGTHCRYLPAQPGALKLRVPQPATIGAELAVKLISAGTPTYSVARGE